MARISELRRVVREVIGESLSADVRRWVHEVTTEFLEERFGPRRVDLGPLDGQRFRAARFRERPARIDALSIEGDDEV